MRRITIILFLLFTSVAAAAQQKCEALVTQVMDVSGLNQVLAVTPELMRQMAAAQLDQAGSMSVETKRALQSVMANGFNVERISKNIKIKLNSSCNPTLFSAALEQMQSPLGTKMLQMELHPVSTPEEAKRMQRYVASFGMQSPRESRMRLIRRLMDVTKAAENYEDEVLSITVIMMEAAYNSAPPKEAMATIRADLLPQVQQMMEGQMYYTYRGASDEELEQYIVVQGTKPMQRMTQDISNALIYAFSQDATEMAAQIRKIALEEKAKHGPAR